MKHMRAKHVELSNAVVRETGCQALLDVVELHSPILIHRSRMAPEVEIGDCAGCPGLVQGEAPDWPCETIRVIAKAMKVDLS